ncbi:MAG TPA: hypothetical protein VN776_01675 [Terracidiphilus sp.]|nr:hypothetical protein [Terracidiphilus sp.]
MRKKWWIFLVAPPAIVLFTWIFGEVVMHLWNWLLPPLFGWHQVTFWQALGLLILCRILFGGFGGHGGDRSGSRRFMGKRWERMTPEEREKFRERMRARCGDFREPPSETGAPA